jgi:hypothetical protein
VNYDLMRIAVAVEELARALQNAGISADDLEVRLPKDEFHSLRTMMQNDRSMVDRALGGNVTQISGVSIAMKPRR